MCIHTMFVANHIMRHLTQILKTITLNILPRRGYSQSAIHHKNHYKYKSQLMCHCPCVYTCTRMRTVRAYPQEYTINSYLPRSTKTKETAAAASLGPQ